MKTMLLKTVRSASEEGAGWATPKPNIALYGYFVPSQRFCAAAVALLSSVLLVVPALNGIAQTTNKVLSLDGTTGYVSVPSSPDLQSAAGMTVEMWIFPLAVDTHDWFLEKGDGASDDSQQSYQLDWVVDGGNTGIGVGAEFSFFLNTSTWALLGAKLPGSNWVHIAASFNSTSGLFQLFTNGILASATNRDAVGAVPLAGQTIRQTTLPVNIGGQVGIPGSTYGVPVHGFLDEVRIWNVARSAQDIYANMFCRLTGAETNLAGYWNFDNGTANDLTGHGHNGTLEGNAQIVPIVGNDAVHAGVCGAWLTARAATARATVVNEFVVGATITDCGYGYTNTPALGIIGGGGSGAQAVAVVSNGVVVAISILDAGSGYTNTPLIVIAPPSLPQHFAATATATLLNGFVVGATLTDGGLGYTNTPGVRIIGGGGSGAQAVAVVTSGVVVAVNVLDAGDGYINAPVVVIAPPFIPQPTVSVSAALTFGPLVTPVVELDLGSLSPYDNYQLESTPTPGGAWTNLGSPFTPTSTTSTQYIPATGNMGFLRLKYVP